MDLCFFNKKKLNHIKMMNYQWKKHKFVRFISWKKCKLITNHWFSWMKKKMN